MWKRIGSYGASAIALLSFLFLSLMAGKLIAQSLETSVNKERVGPGEQFEYSITLKNAKGRIHSPDFKEFSDVQGPARSTRVRMVNGRVSRQIEFSYTIRAPKKEGKYRIGPAKAQTGEGVLKGDAIEVHVDPNASTGKKAESSSASGKGGGRLIARIRTEPSTVFEGEEVRVTYELYSRYRNIRLTQRKFPSIDGAWTEGVEDASTGWQDGLSRIDGKPYKKAILKRALIYPQRSGELRIEPMELTCVVNRGFFNQGEKKKVRSNAPHLQVRSLPPGAPASFQGAVGDYELQAELDQNEVKTDASVNLRVKIEGRGNLKLIEGPKAKIPPDLEHYDPNVEQRMNVAAQGVYGSKEWEYLLIPRQSGTYEIGPIEFSYFDPKEEEYRTHLSGPFELKVDPGKGGGEQKRIRTKGKKEEVKVLKKDLRYIRTELEDLKDRRNEGENGIRNIALLAPPFVGALLFLIIGRRRKHGAGKLHKARKTARKRLKDAEKALKSGKRAVFHEEIYKALHDYFSDRLALPLAELDRENIEAGLRENGVPEASIERSMEILKNSDMMRYAPSHDFSDRQVHADTVELLAELDGYLK